MADEESYIVKQRDLSEIIREHNEGAVQEFMKDPLSAVAGAVNELLLHPTAIGSTAIRVAHAVLKGKLFQQFANEIKDWQAKGKLPADFAEKKHGYNTWVDLLKVIDDECPDEDRLEALKAMFYAANAVNTADGERIVAYELFQIAKTVSSNELLVLKALWRLAKEGRTDLQAEHFFESARKILGHSQTDLIVLAYTPLLAKRLVEGYRLSPLGRTFCQNIETYEINRPTQSAPA